MTVTYDPHHPNYLEQADTRAELSRVFDICGDCRRCVTLCSTFPTLFEVLDARAQGAGAVDGAGAMTPAEQDAVTSQCIHCMMCSVNCPYTPDQHESAVDFPRLMLRAGAMQRAAGLKTWRSKLATVVLGHTDVVGAVGVLGHRVANRLLGAKPGSLLRKVLQVATGVSSRRVLPTFARMRFSTWFKQRPKVRLGQPQGSVSVYPTCMVEYLEPEIGRALVKVYEHNGVECTVSLVKCCGAPYLHGGDLSSFTKVAVDNVATLAKEVKRGRTIVVAQPTCGYVLKNDYVDYVGGPDARLVAQNTFDPSEYLMNLHQTPGASLDTQFNGAVPSSVTYHAPCHVRAQGSARKSRDLLKLTGARVQMIEQCAGVDGLLGLRAEAAAQSSAAGEALGAQIRTVGDDVVVGDCHLSNTVIREQTSIRPSHPLQILASAYGIEVPRDEH